MDVVDEQGQHALGQDGGDERVDGLLVRLELGRALQRRLELRDVLGQVLFALLDVCYLPVLLGLVLTPFPQSDFRCVLTFAFCPSCVTTLPSRSFVVLTMSIAVLCLLRPNKNAIAPRAPCSLRVSYPDEVAGQAKQAQSPGEGKERNGKKTSKE